MIEQILNQEIGKCLAELYSVTEQSIQFQKTRKDFKGDVTLVVFPLLRASKKGPEQTAEEIGNYLKENDYFFPVCYSLSRPPFKFEPQDKNFRSLIVSRKGRIIMDNFEPINWESNEIRDVLNGLIK